MRHLMLGLCLFLPSVGLAQPYGYSAFGPDLVEFDLTTGDPVSVRALAGPIFVSGLTMTFGGDLLAIETSTDNLWQIDSTDASTTLVGALGITIEVGAGLTQDACGTVWLTNDSALYRVDVDTGAAKFVTALSEQVSALTSSGTTLLGLARPSGRRLATVDTGTGSVDLFGEAAGAPSAAKGLDFDADGRLWGVSVDPSLLPLQSPTIVEYEPATGSVVNENTLGSDNTSFQSSLAIAPPSGFCGSAADVPISPGVAWILLVALGVVGVLRSRFA